MPNVPPTFKHSLPPKDPAAASNWRSLRQAYEQVARVINGKLSLGQTSAQQLNTTVQCDNLDSVSIYASVTQTGGNDIILTHNLGRIPSGYIVVSKTVSCDFYDGIAAWTNTTISLRCSITLVANNLKVLVW